MITKHGRRSACEAITTNKGQGMQTGKVKWFDTAKRYGFISPDDGGTDVFLHLSNIADPACPTIQPGLRLQYSLERKGDKLTDKDVCPAPALDVARDKPAARARPAVNFEEEFE